ncbi:hypothetical protein TanjilG_20374 [Lupinus angustifolius]|uniref:WRKY domain-containing protein n=1 Tax=Lupinus angustifolius TaxID=3871 RepID=A0A4P1RVL5_LUPAN|nr:PREDICTED: probable WRKY transcription factor 65 isoform X2 [Lupinus angustifolius]OIW19249.1 hypothetical protein TanjilG_20374 [Lupinus angustifolius]
MDSKLRNTSSYMNEQEDSDVGGQENFVESSPYNMDAMVTSPSTSTSSLKRRRGTQKKVVQIPIKEIEGSISNTPPSDSWAWRKYGQKPIKGSPYPRGYYRCSSNKGCPARKQVERSRIDPTILVVTYSSEHNHASPVFKNHHHHNHSRNNNNNRSSSTAAKPIIKPELEQVLAEPVEPELIAEPVEPELIAEPVEPEDKFSDEFGWFGEMEAIATTSSTVLESPIFGGYDDDVASVFVPMREEDELLFADLGELPEFSPVFKRGSLETADEWRGWCGTTS